MHRTGQIGSHPEHSLEPESGRLSPNAGHVVSGDATTSEIEVALRGAPGFEWWAESVVVDGRKDLDVVEEFVDRRADVGHRREEDLDDDWTAEVFRERAIRERERSVSDEVETLISIVGHRSHTGPQNRTRGRGANWVVRPTAQTQTDAARTCRKMRNLSGKV